MIEIHALELSAIDPQELNAAVYAQAKDLERGFYALSELIYAAWNIRIWERLEVDSWEEWLANVRLYKGQASDLLRIAELRRQFPEYEPRILDTPPSNLRLLLPHLEQDRTTRAYGCTPGLLDSLLDDANMYSWRQLREKLNAGFDVLDLPEFAIEPPTAALRFFGKRGLWLNVAAVLDAFKVGREFLTPGDVERIIELAEFLKEAQG